MNLSSGYPFWLVRYGMPFDYPVLQENINTDVIIMGGGISGALVAYYLINAGISCVVVDGRSIGLGSTCASTSLLQYEIDTPLCKLKDKIGLKNAVTAYKLCDDAINELEAIAKKIKFPEFEKQQSLYYAALKKDTGFIKEEFYIRRQNGFDVKYMNEEMIFSAFGFSSPAAILSQQGAQTNAYSFAHALHQAAIKKGAQVYARTLIKNIEHSKASVAVTSAEGFTVKAKKLVYATGYESVKYIDKKIVRLHSTYAVCSEQGNADEAIFKNRAMLWNTADPYLYLRTTADNRVLIGGRDENFFNPHQRDSLLKSKTKALVTDFKKIYPAARFKPEFSWCGTFGATEDGLPFIGSYKNIPNGYFALGFGGNGITFSLIAAQMLKDMILGKKVKAAEIFSFDRI